MEGSAVLMLDFDEVEHDAVLAGFAELRERFGDGKEPADLYTALMMRKAAVMEKKKACSAQIKAKIFKEFSQRFGAAAVELSANSQIFRHLHFDQDTEERSAWMMSKLNLACSNMEKNVLAYLFRVDGIRHQKAKVLDFCLNHEVTGALSNSVQTRLIDRLCTACRKADASILRKIESEGKFGENRMFATWRLKDLRL